jgi:hypothetical protein
MIYISIFYKDKHKAQKCERLCFPSPLKFLRAKDDNWKWRCNQELRLCVMQKILSKNIILVIATNGRGTIG